MGVVPIQFEVEPGKRSAALDPIGWGGSLDVERVDGSRVAVDSVEEGGGHAAPIWPIFAVGHEGFAVDLEIRATRCRAHRTLRVDDNPFGSLWVGELVGQSILRRGILRSKMDIGPGDATSDLDLRVC